MSFFSNLLGMRSKRLEKESKVEDKAEKDKVIREALLGDVIGRADQQAKKLAKGDADRIIGGTYPPRGNPMPEKRLREWRHTVENLTLGPKKLNLVAKLIRKLPVPEARLQLRYSKKAISKDVLLVLDQACMKARERDNIHIKDLIVGQCYVGGKIIGHKVDIKARGKSGKITKRVSHLNIILYENPALVKGFESRTLLPGKYAQKRRTSKEPSQGNESQEQAVPKVNKTTSPGMAPLRQGYYQAIAH